MTKSNFYLLLDDLLEIDPDTTSWDWQWMFTSWSRDGLAVTPAVNLVSNIGDGPDSLHCNHHPLGRLPVHDWTDTEETPQPRPNRNYDRSVFEDFFPGGPIHGWAGIQYILFDFIHAWRVRLGIRSKLTRAMKGLGLVSGKAATRQP